MYGLQEVLSRERCAELRRRSSERRLTQQDAVARRWRRRGGAPGAGPAGTTRGEYELAGH